MSSFEELEAGFEHHKKLADSPNAGVQLSAFAANYMQAMATKQLVETQRQLVVAQQGINQKLAALLVVLSGENANGIKSWCGDSDGVIYDLMANETSWKSMGPDREVASAFKMEDTK